MSDNKIQLFHWDYDKQQRVEDEVVFISAIARCMTEENFVKLFDDFLNYGGKGWETGKAVGEKFRTTHRTIQASAVRFMFGFLSAISDQNYTDARNETAIKSAKKIKQMLDDNELSGGLYI